MSIADDIKGAGDDVSKAFALTTALWGIWKEVKSWWDENHAHAAHAAIAATKTVVSAAVQKMPDGPEKQAIVNATKALGNMF